MPAMRHPPLAAILASLILLTLVGCERPAAPTVRAVAPAASPVTESAVPGADSDGMDGLMAEAFPAWKADRFAVLKVPAPDSPKERMTVAIHPATVVKLDAAHRALVTVGHPSEGTDENTASHGDPAVVGVYLFELRKGRWFKTRAQDAVVWSGSSGELDGIDVAELGAGHPALLVKGSYGGQGETIDALDVVEVEPAGARVVLPGLQVHEDLFGGASQGCEDWVKGLREPTDEELANEFESQCQEVTGQWRIEPAGESGRGDIVVAYKSHGVEVDPETHLNAFVVADETVRYRYSASGYVKLEAKRAEPASAVSPSASSPA